MLEGFNMKILILIITITWSFGIGHENKPSFKIVSSPEQAAIYVYNDKPPSFMVEPDRKQYNLYEIDIEAKTINEIKIPKLTFQQAQSSGAGRLAR